MLRGQCLSVGRDSKSQPANHKLDGAVGPSPQECCGEGFLKMTGLQEHHLMSVLENKRSSH